MPLRRLVLTLCVAAASPALAQSLKPDEVLSSIALAPVAAPHPVLGADGRTHLAYELAVSNASKLFVTLDKVEALAGETVLAALEGAALASMAVTWGGGDPASASAGPRLAPGGAAIILLDVALPPEAAVPAELAARVALTREIAGADGKPAPFPATEPVPASVAFTGARVVPGAPAVVLDPPLRGKGWVAANGCCDSITSHRGAIFAVNGALKAPERFAIDWVQLQPDGKLFTGDATRLESYPYYGAPVHAAADGVVVNLYDAAEEQIPAGEITGITTENIGGNMLVTDIGGGAFAFYAHLQKGSLKAGLGDRVKAGEVIGLLGNTGNTTAPHLHFHVMDGPSPLDAQGLPFVLRSFTVEGSLPEDGVDRMIAGEAIALTGQDAGAKRDALPLNDDVADFGPEG